MALSSFSVSAKGLDGIPYRVDVNGGGTAVTGDGQFLVIEGGEEQDRGLDPIWPKRLRLFMREDVDLSPLFGEADRAVDVEVQDVTGGTDTLVYRGFMVTDFYSDAPFEPKPLIELQALDGLGTLENDSLSALYSGGTEVTVKSGITSILSTLYPLEVEIGTEWYPDAGGSLGASDNPLENVKFAADNYREERPDGDAFQSQLAVLRDLCIGQGLVVKQVERPGGARWLVAQRSAYNSDGTLKVWTYDTAGALKSGEPSTRDRSITLDVNGRDLLREHTREFVRRRQAVEVTHDHTPLDDFVGDGGFEDAGDGKATPWSIRSTPKLSAQVVSHDGPDNTPSASQQNTYLLEISGSPDGGNNFPQDSFEFPVSQSLGEVTGAQPKTAGRIKQSFEGNQTVLTPKDEDGIAIRVSIGAYWLGVRSSSLTTDVKRGTGSLYCGPLDRPIPEGAALPVIKPNPPEDQPGNEFRGTITLSERAESGDTELVGDLTADFNTPMKVLYPSIESSPSVFPIQRFVDNPRVYPRFEIVFPFEDPSGNPLEGEVTYEVGGIDLILEETGQRGTKSYSADSVYLDDVEFALTRGGQEITQTVVEASVAELGEEEAQTARTFSGPTDQNLARLRGVGFEATGWGIGVGGGSLSLAELKARGRLRYWRNHTEMWSVTGVDRDGTTQLTGDELVTLDGQTYTIHSTKYDAAQGETELTLIEYEDRGTSGITLETVLVQSEGGSGSTSGSGGGAVGGGGGVSDWDELTGELSGPVPFDATDDDGNPTSRSLQFLNVTPQVDVTSDPASGIALEIKDQTNGNRLGTLTTDGRWETRGDMEAFADGSFGSGSSTNSLLQVENASTVLTTDAASIDFTGSGVNVSVNGDDVTVDVSGGSGSGIDIESNQTVVVGGATGLSFEGSGIDSVSNDGDGTATVNISKGRSTEVQEGGTAQVTDVTVLDFVGGDFSVANPTSGEAEVSLQNDTVTVAGNSVSLGNSTAINHGDLSSIGSSDHHPKTTSASDLTDVSADSVTDAHHAVFEPADYTPGNDVSKSDVGLGNVPNVNPRSEMRNLGLRNEEMDASWVGGQSGGEVGYDASVGLFLDYGSAGGGVSKDVYPVLDVGNTKTGSNVNVTYNGIDSRPKISLSQGSGSGLDADTLDGVEGSNYARTDVVENFSGDVTFGSNATPQSTVQFGDHSSTSDVTVTMGRVGQYRAVFEWNRKGTIDATIGMNANEELLIENNFGGPILFQGNAGFGGETAPSYAVETAGDMRATGEVEAFLGSDRRLKTDLDPLDSALDKVDQLTGYGFDWREGEAVQPHKRGETDVGLIAQEVEEALPKAVKTFTDGHSEGYKSVSYDKIVPLLVEAIKDLRSQVHNLQ